MAIRFLACSSRTIDSTALCYASSWAVCGWEFLGRSIFLVGAPGARGLRSLRDFFGSSTATIVTGLGARRFLDRYFGLSIQYSWLYRGFFGRDPERMSP